MDVTLALDWRPIVSVSSACSCKEFAYDGTAHEGIEYQYISHTLPCSGKHLFFLPIETGK